MDSLPIDINYNKLLDWLISRRHCNQQWQPAAYHVREKIKAAIQDMPEHEEVTALLQGTYINYFHCRRIVEILRQTEAGSRNMFGRYSSQRMKDWQEVVSLYEKDGLFLAEAAQQLARNVNYEIAGVKRSLEKSKKAQADCAKKQAEQMNMSNEARGRFRALCTARGLTGLHLQTELVAQARDLPAQLSALARRVGALLPAAQYYRAFVTHSLGSDLTDDLPLLRFLAAEGDVTVYQWRHGAAPTRIESPSTHLHEVAEVKADAPDEGDIDWGADDIVLDDPDVLDAIDLDLKVVEEDEPGVARGDEARTILEDAATRTALIDELLELEAFLTQRHLEMTSEHDLVSATNVEDTPAALQLSPQQVEDMRGDVTAVMAALTTERMRELIQIVTSPRYVERVAQKIQQVSDDAEKYKAMSELMVERAAEARKEEGELMKQLEIVRKKTKELQRNLEAEISKKYNDRKVNIMGEINTI